MMATTMWPSLSWFLTFILWPLLLWPHGSHNDGQSNDVHNQRRPQTTTITTLLWTSFFMAAVFVTFIAWLSFFVAFTVMVCGRHCLTYMMLFGLLARMDESADVRKTLTEVPQSDWKRPAGCPHTSRLTTMKNNPSSQNLGVEDATELALMPPSWH